jgi:GntR family transcriptional regulator/MocR family aminotransferase
MNTSYKFAFEKIKANYEVISRENKELKYLILYKSIKDCVVKIDLPFDWLLPSTRVLAQNLGLSRTTVNKAYELLQLEKMIVSKAGSGYKVCYKPTTTKNHSDKNEFLKNTSQFPELSEKGKAFAKNISLVNKSFGNNIAFRPGLPPLDSFPVNQWQRLLNTYWRHIKSSNLAHSAATGIEELKKSVSEYLHVSRGIKCDSAQIVIVSGSLQSLYLIATTLLNKKDHVVLENPVFPNVHSIFKSSEATLIPTKLDEQGLDIASLGNLTVSPKLIHVTPSNHYPLGTKMSLIRRQELIDWASKHKAMIIENDYENEIANQHLQIPSIYSLDNEDRTIYMGTFNRLLHPSIRLGYMIVPQYLIKPVEALQEHSHKFVSPSIQVVMTQFIARNYLYQHLRNIISVANKRFHLFKSTFNTISEHMYIATQECYSFHVVAKLKNQSEEKLESKILEDLNRKDIEAHSLSKCYIGSKKKYGLILGFSAVNEREILKKLSQMKGII